MPTPTACDAPPATSPSEWVQLGAGAESLSRAAACYHDALRADPTSHAAALAAGLLAARQRAGRGRADAPGLLRRAASLALRQSNATAAVEALRGLGELHMRSGRWDDADSAFSRALAFEPLDCAASANLASARASSGRPEAAVNALRAALAEDHACVLAHHGLAQLLGQLGDRAQALAHARAALELRPFDHEYERTLQALLAADGGVRDSSVARAPSRFGGGGGGGGRGEGGEHGEGSEGSEGGNGRSGTTALDGGATPPAAVGCGAGASWRSPPLPSELKPPAACADQRISAAKGRRSSHRRRAATDARGGGGSGSGDGGGDGGRYLLVNPFEEGCFHDDLRDGSRQEYHSCGQFNNVLASLLHALALSRLLCRTLLLPGFFVRFGARLTRVSPFRERWLPTSHFFNLTLLQTAFDVRELRDWLPTDGSSRSLPTLHTRAVGGAPPQLRFFAYHNVTFETTRPSRFPFVIQQQSELRWVEQSPPRSSFFSRYEAGYGAAFWRASFADGGEAAAKEAADAPVLAFDAAPSLGMFIDHLRWDESLRYVRGHVRYVGAVHAEATRVRASLFGPSAYLAVHIRRGADRLHDFCHTGWGQRCFGWNITMEMCYPSAEAVAAQIKAALARWGLPDGHVFLATDSPRPEVCEPASQREGERERAAPHTQCTPVHHISCGVAPSPSRIPTVSHTTPTTTPPPPPPTRPPARLSLPLTPLP